MIFGLTSATSPTEVAEFTMWFEPVNVPSDWDVALSDLATACADAWSSVVDPTHFSPAVTLTGAEARHAAANGATLQKQRVGPTDPWIGTGGNASLPWETSFQFGLYTYTPGTFIAHGRRRRGRNYWPPMTTSVLSGQKSGFIDSGIAADLATDAGQFYTKCGLDLAGAHPRIWTLGVLSRMDSHLYQVTDIRYDTRLDSQRRREKGELAPAVSNALPQV